MPYENPWTNLDDKDANIHLEKPDFSERMGTTPLWGTYIHSEYTFYTQTITPTSSGQYQFVFFPELELQKPVMDTGAYTLLIDWIKTPTVVSTDTIDLHKKIIQFWHRYDMLSQLNKLSEREDDWDGYGSKKPTESTVNYAKHLMEELFDAINQVGSAWDPPIISSDQDGYVTAAWYEEERELHIQIGENVAEYIQVWGTNIDTEMHVDFLYADDYCTLWEWLMNE